MKAKKATPQNEAPKKGELTKRRAERRTFGAQQKTEAVLSIWSGSRTPSEVCEEMEIAWAMLSSWEDRALKAMLDALRPRRRPQEERGPMLPSRLLDLLDRKSLESSTRLDKRLRKVQKETQTAKG
jgi:hypothetical protein